MATRKAPAKVAHKTGHVSFKYRSGGGSGTVTGVVAGAGTAADPMLSIRPDKASRHPGEPALIHRRNSKVHK